MNERPTQKALIACAKWLAWCRKNGWTAEQLDGLEALWWAHHDRNGNFVAALSAPRLSPADSRSDDQKTPEPDGQEKPLRMGEQP